MLLNMLLSWYRGRDLAQQGSKTEPLHDKDILHDAAAHDEEVKARSKTLTFLANHLHLSTFLPLAIITILQDVNLGLAAVVCVAEITFFMLLGFVLYRTSYIKVFPKKYDVFNFQLYLTITILAYAAPHWLHNWLSFYVNVSNATFMWWTILLPCFDCFVMDNVRDRLPDCVARHPLAQHMALALSITWAVALSIMAAAALVPAVANVPPGSMGLMIILCSYVFGIGPIIVATLVQAIISYVFKKRIRATIQAMTQQRAADTAAAAAEEGTVSASAPDTAAAAAPPAV
ncbi:hypothetical protein COO60DRAFT_771840 [Scenedesmus sp. NREL 46B-D3]|nr:hypothetical protein COO60DRAFT_771840 [Scenedesmus sp. NREL 46B-D3]